MNDALHYEYERPYHRNVVGCFIDFICALKPCHVFFVVGKGLDNAPVCMCLHVFAIARN